MKKKEERCFTGYIKILLISYFLKKLTVQTKMKLGGDMFFSHGKNDSRGVVILFKNTITKEIHNVIADPLGRYLIIDVTLDDIRCTLCNIYGPNTDSPNFFLNVHEMIETIDNETKLIGGDFNTILNLDTDKKITAVSLKSKYPQGAEKMLIYALTGRKVPAGGAGCPRIDQVGEPTAFITAR